MATIQPEANDLTVQQAQAIASLPPDMALLRMENEHIMAVAQARPRDYGKIKKELFDMIDAFPDSAENAIYNKPVGTVFMVNCKCGHRYEVAAKWNKSKRTYELQDQTPCPRCDKWQPDKEPRRTKKFARGLSIRSAENMRVAFGFNRVSSALTPLDDGDRYKITGTFTDYTNGNVTIDEQIITPFFTTYDKQRMRMSDDRFFNVIVKAEKSKVIREVVLRSVPGTLKAAYEDHCEKAIDSLLTEGTIDKIINQFASAGVSQDMIERLLGRPRSMGWTKEDRKQLLGIWNAIDDGESTVAEVFSDGLQQNGQAKTPDAGVTMDDLTGQAEKKPAKKATKKKAEAESNDWPSERYDGPKDQGEMFDKSESATEGGT